MTYRKWCYENYLGENCENLLPSVADVQATIDANGGSGFSSYFIYLPQLTPAGGKSANPSPIGISFTFDSEHDKWYKEDFGDDGDDSSTLDNPDNPDNPDNGDNPEIGGEYNGVNLDAGNAGYSDVDWGNIEKYVFDEPMVFEFE